MTKSPRPLALIILDGWGYREETDANAIAKADIPFWDHLWEQYPHTLISGSGHCVGLPDGQMGNSEVGHLNMGAGRIVYQDLTRIDEAIHNKDFFSNPVLTETIDETVKNKKRLHILGLISPGGVHSHENQIAALLTLAAERHATEVYIHAFLDGRDTPPRSAMASLNVLTTLEKRLGCGKIVSIIGRYFAMDRDKRYERTEQAYHLLTLGTANFTATTAESALELAYARGENDEFVSATTIHPDNTAPITIQDGDAVIFMNFRSDRARQLTRAFVDPEFTGFTRQSSPAVNFVTLTQYDATLSTKVAFPPVSLTQLLGEYLSELGLRQLRIAETEKYAHVTFFFNGGVEQPYPGEDRILIPSAKVKTYDLKPEMSAPEITDSLVKAIQDETYDVIICNFANPDMLGHTGNLPATVEAIEVIDRCLKKIITALLAVGGEALITADHGNAEMMYNHTTQQPHTAHTSEKVPLIYIGRLASIAKSDGKLSDIAPTLLSLLDIPQPKEMTGTPLFTLTKQ